MSKRTRRTTQEARDELAAQQDSGTHNPAAPCGTCGAWRTPGIVHAPPGKTVPTCAN